MGAGHLHNTVDLRSVFLDGAAPDSRHRQQLAGRFRPRAGYRSQYPIAKNAEGRHTAVVRENSVPTDFVGFLSPAVYERVGWYGCRDSTTRPFDS